MGFLEIFLKVVKNLVGLLMSWFFNTSNHHSGGDEDRTTTTSSFSTPPRQNYEVFLSFRGEDTRHGFTDHLYHRLVDRGINVFRDNEELHVGEKIDRLFGAIRASKISILIISPNYASSIWCLKELLQILECKKMSGQVVLPIFYHIKPSDVREQKGNFGKSFRLCKRKHGLEGKFVQDIENAFTEVTEMKGWESDKTADGYEGKLVKEVVARIFDELEKAVLVVPDFLVGVEDHVKKIKKMIDTKPNDAKIIGIYGMGGIGKTTLAKVLYNVLCNDFECLSFVPNVREASKTKGMETLQKQIIDDILVGESKREISHVDEGITIIEQRFKGKKLLLLLDDVEDKDQLNKLVAKNSWVGSESIVIITTRNKDVTVASAVNLSYPLNELTMDQSYELFCKHAFGRDASCPRDLENIARHIVFTTGGLPLAVEVIGSLLCQKDEDFWKEALEKLRRVPNEKVRDKLKISYDYLEYGQQQIFLDIACFSFKDKSEIEYASYMWKSCGLYPKEGIERLKSLSLIKRADSLITVHDQLRDLGREIVHKEGRDNIELCSRIWLQEEAIEVMERNQEICKVQALVLHTSDARFDPSPSELNYRSEDFEGMPNLRLLRMVNVHLRGDFEKLFPNLRWLRWGREFLNSPRRIIDVMGINFNPKKLVVLELFDGNVGEYWKGWSQMKDLKVITLKRCMNLIATPDFSTLKELEVLILDDCWGLKRINPSIGKFKKTLKVVKVIRCCDLQELPVELGEMEELRELDIRDTPIREIPIFNGYMTKLERLSVQGCRSLLYIPDSLGSLVKLRRLDLPECGLVTKIPESIGKLTSLITLDLRGSGVMELPDSIGELCNLESLRMEKTPINCLPASIGMLSKLRELDLMGCKELQSLPNLPSSLMSLNFCGDSMETLPDLSMLTNLKHLRIEDKELMEIPALQELKSLELLDVSGCKSLQHLPDLSQCTNLTKLVVEGCENLTEIGGLENLTSLEYLNIRGCSVLSKLPTLPNPKVYISST